MHKKFGLKILKKYRLKYFGWKENVKICLGNNAGDCEPNSFFSGWDQLG